MNYLGIGFTAAVWALMLATLMTIVVRRCRRRREEDEDPGHGPWDEAGDGPER